jgi:serine O-acetyltransferase
VLEHIRSDYRLYRSVRNRALWAMALYRFGRWSRGLPAPLRWLTGKAYGLLGVFAPILTGVTIDRRMQVGKHFHIIHPGGIIIHPGVVFGDRCGIMHHVTVGTNMQRRGVPRIGNDVFIGTGAVVVGPITIGDGATIAANSLVFFDVPADALAMGVPAVIHAGKSKLRKPKEEEGSSNPMLLPSTPPGDGPGHDPTPAKAA